MDTWVFRAVVCISLTFQTEDELFLEQLFKGKVLETLLATLNILTPGLTN